MIKLLVEHAVELSLSALILALVAFLFLASFACLLSFLTFGGG